MSVEIRPAHEHDMEEILQVNERAFEQPGEGALVKALWKSVDPCISLVAELEDGHVVGHIFFTPVRVELPNEAGEFRAMALGPMSVDPPHQNRGIGSALVKAGLDACLRREELVVFVLGHPGYYPRFGFESASSRGIDCEFPVPEGVFMVQELVEGALRGRQGTVRYHRAFHEL